MTESRASRTAYMAAMRRAADQLVDRPPILDDPIALPILGQEAQERLRSQSRLAKRSDRAVRASMVARSRYAQDQLARAVKTLGLIGSGQAGGGWRLSTSCRAPACGGRSNSCATPWRGECRARESRSALFLFPARSPPN